MRTKTLLLTAAALAAGLVGASAQVYSQNVVGYVNVSVPAGFTMISNPLKTTNDSINTVLAGAPEGALLFKFNNGFGNPAEYGGGQWDTPSMTLKPGEGAFLYVPSSNNIVFVGEVVQGTSTNPLPNGFSIAGSIVPQSGGLESVLGFPATAGDLIFRFNKNTQTYANGGAPYESAGGGGWDPIEPVPAVAEGFWIFNSTGSPKNWVRTFNVN